MNIYFGRFQVYMPDSVVITSGIGKGDYNSLIYAKTCIYTAEQILSSSMDNMLGRVRRIELSHLTRTEYRDICIFLVRLCKTMEYDFDLYVPNMPECEIILRESQLVSKWNSNSCGVEEELTATDEYSIPDEPYIRATMLRVDKEGNIISSSGKRDSVFSLGFISYDTKYECDSPYVRVINDFEYIHNNPYFTRKYGVSLRGTISQTKVSVWDNLNRVGLDELSMCYVENNKEYCLCRRKSRVCKYKHRDKKYYFISADSNVTSPDVDVIERYQTYPVDSILALVFARVVCRNQSKINPDIVLELCYDNAAIPIVVDEENCRLIIDKFVYNYNVLREYAKELSKQTVYAEDKVQIYAQYPRRLYDLYAASAELAYDVKDALCSKVMVVETHPMISVLSKNQNTTIADTLYVDFSHCNEEYTYAAELLETLETMLSEGLECAYKYICIKPGSDTESAFSCVLS